MEKIGLNMPFFEAYGMVVKIFRVFSCLFVVKKSEQFEELQRILNAASAGSDRSQCAQL